MMYVPIMNTDTTRIMLYKSVYFCRAYSSLLLYYIFVWSVGLLSLCGKKIPVYK